MKDINKDNDCLSFSFLFSIYDNSTHQFMRGKLDEFGIASETFLPILFDCYSYDKQIHQKDLRRHLDRKNALLTRQLRQLEDDGFIERIEDDENRRENIITLTEKGDRITKELIEMKCKREEEILKNLDISVTQFREILIKMIEESDEYNKKNIK